MTADDTFGRLDDDDYPAYTMGRAAEMLGTTQGFLRAIGEARLITPSAPRAATAATPATSCASPPGLANSSTGAPPSRPPAGLSSSKTSSRKPSASTPNTGAPPNQRSRRQRLETSVPSASTGTARTAPVCGVIFSSGDAVWA